MNTTTHIDACIAGMNFDTDVKAAKKARKLALKGKTEKLEALLRRTDTAPREYIMEALEADNLITVA